MQELTNELKTAVRDAKLNQGDSAELRCAAVEWAVFALNNHDDVLLKKSLAVSAAVVDFCNEVERDV